MNDQTPADFLGRRVDMELAIAEGNKPLPWIVDDLVLEGSVTLLTGRGGIGKTWLGLELCRAVAGGTSAVGFEAKQGRALYLDWENGSRRMGRRFAAMGLAADTFDVFGMVGTRLLPDDHDGFATMLRATIERTGARLVVLDSLRRMTAGAAEDKSDDMGPILSRLSAVAQATNAGLVVVHHARKDGGSRGSGAIEDQVDAVYDLSRRNTTAPVDVDCSKQRDAEMLPKFAFRIASSSGVLALEPIIGTDRPEPKEDLTPTMKAVADFLASNAEVPLAAIKGAVSGRGEKVARAVARLVELEHVRVRDMGRGLAKNHRLVKPYPPLAAVLAETQAQASFGTEWPCAVHDQAWRATSSTPLRCGLCDPPTDASLVNDWVSRPGSAEAAA